MGRVSAVAVIFPPIGRAFARLGDPRFIGRQSEIGDSKWLTSPDLYELHSQFSPPPAQLWRSVAQVCFDMLTR